MNKSITISIIFQVPIVPQEECKSVYKDYYISNNMFCAGLKDGGSDSCTGDSGGPLMCETVNEITGERRWTLYGITSFGEGCGQKGKYGIYTKVPNFKNWIKNTIAENDPQNDLLNL